MIRSLLLAGASTLVLTSAAGAADLGGNCCADLEERIAELEATTDRKANRKVSLIVYGEVNKAIAWTKDDQAVIDNTSEESRVGFSGQAKFSGEGKAGFILELHTNYLNEDGYSYPEPTASSTINVRRSAVWVGYGQATVTLGLFDTATHELIDMSTANTTVAVKPLNILGETPQAGIADLVRGDVKLSENFVISASWAPGYFGGDDLFSAAARYNDKVGGFKVLAGLGYDKMRGGGDGLMSGLVSVMHEETGVFLTAAGVRPDHESVAWHVAGGLERKFVELGKTTVFAEYGDWKSLIGSDAKGWGLGAVQRVDAAATDLYVSFRDYDGETLVLTGARVSF